MRPLLAIPVVRLGLLAAWSFAGAAPLRADTLIATQTYTTPGATTYTLPANTYRVVVKVWGAGGNGMGGDHGENGGTAGFVKATYSVAASTVINVRVGAAPGGASGAWVTSGFQVIGAGGGSAGDSDDGEGAGAGAGGSGGSVGAGGGYAGGDGGEGGGGAGSSSAGGGGSSTSGSGSAGTGPLNLGSYAANGGAGYGSGHGGSGYYGGGGGARSETNGANGGGGGGSNYLDLGNGYVSGTNTTGGADDPHYSASLKYGKGGERLSPTASDGAVVILVYAANQSPVANFTPTPNAGRAPLSVSFNGSASSDPNAGGSITTHAWDFDNNGSTDATGSTANNTFQNTGTSVLTQTVKLTVTDNDSSPASGNTTQTITVYPASSRSLAVQSGSITSAVVPFYQPGTVVSVSANPPAATALFANWIVVSGNGTFAAGTSSSTTFTIGSADTTIKATYGPTVPGSFTSPSSTATSINLSWTASTDDVAVSHYVLYRVQGGLALFAANIFAPATNFSDTHVRPGTSYGYFLKAVDGGGNGSNATSTVTVTTPALPDADGDGLPDAFETLFGTTANANPSGETSRNLNVHRPSP
jgi:PKD repeat protein